MLAVLLLLIGAAGPPEPPPTVATFCLDSAGRYQPIVRTNYGRLKAAFQRQFGFRARLLQSSPQSGTLTFYGPGRSSEAISYRVRPYNSGTGVGVALLSMRVRLEGKSEDLRGDDMCWQTFGIINTR